MTNPITKAAAAKAAASSEDAITKALEPSTQGAAESVELPTSPALQTAQASKQTPAGESPEFPEPNFARQVDTRAPGEPINDRRYICHTAPSTFVFRDRTRFTSPDGIIYASTPAQEAELQHAVRVGNLSVYQGNPFPTVAQTPAR